MKDYAALLQSVNTLMTFWVFFIQRQTSIWKLWAAREDLLLLSSLLFFSCENGEKEFKGDKKRKMWSSGQNQYYRKKHLSLSSSRKIFLFIVFHIYKDM